MEPRQRDTQAEALKSTHRWLRKQEKLWEKDLYRRVYVLRETVQCTSQWDVINDDGKRNSKKKTEDK